MHLPSDTAQWRNTNIYHSRYYSLTRKMTSSARACIGQLLTDGEDTADLGQYCDGHWPSVY